VLKNNPRLIIVTLVDEVLLIVGTGETVIHSHLGMACPNCVLVKEVALIRQVVPVESVGSFADLRIDDRIVVPGKNIDALTGDISGVVDIPTARPFVGLPEKAERAPGEVPSCRDPSPSSLGRDCPTGRRSPCPERSNKVRRR
jgi:hypothetical protein